MLMELVYINVLQYMIFLDILGALNATEKFL